MCEVVFNRERRTWVKESAFVGVGMRVSGNLVCFDKVLEAELEQIKEERDYVVT